jgi:MFS family permease
MVNGALSALGSPSSSAITPQTVPAELLQRAISWRRIAQNVSMIVGSGIAGLLVVWVGSGWALAFDALTFAVSAALFRQVRVAAVAAPSAQEGLWGDVAAGFHEVMRHTWLWLLILQALLYHLFYGGAQSVLGPIVVGDGLGRPAWGWAPSTMMLGVVGGLVTLR